MKTKFYTPLLALCVMLSLTAYGQKSAPKTPDIPLEIPGIDCPLDINIENVCPADASISLTEGEVISIFTTWTVGGVDADPLAACIGSECIAPEDLAFTVMEISITPENCNRTLAVTFQADDACVLAGESFTITYHFTDDTPPEAPPAPEDITIECIKEIPVDEDLTAFDLCQGPISVFGQDIDLGGLGCADDPFIIVRTWTFDDGCGNSTAISQNIFVVDDVAPTWTCVCAGDTIDAGCPGEVEISLEVGDVIDLFTTWNVGGEEVPGLAGCVADNCTEPIDINIHVTDIIHENNGCSQTIFVTFEAEDECGNISEPFTCYYVITDDTPPVPPTVEDITVECLLDIELAEEDLLTAFDECQGPITAAAADTDNGGSGCEDDVLTINRTWTFDDGCGNVASVSQQITVNIPNGGGGEPPVDCSDCDGGLTMLEVAYTGNATGNLLIKSNNHVYYDGALALGQVIELTPMGNRPKLRDNLDFIIDGIYNGRVHTSCSEPIYIGMVFGDFEVTDGISRFGGGLCQPPEIDPCLCNETDPPVDCEPCAGGTVLLEVQYNGTESAGLRIKDGSSVYYNGMVNPGDMITLIPLPGQNRLRNNLDFIVNSSLNAEIHTSCSEPIGPGLVAGDFLITRAVSRVNGEMCPIENNGDGGGGDDDGGGDDPSDCDCAGGTTMLETVYHGSASGNLVIKDKNTYYYNGPVNPGDIINITTLPGENRMRNNLDYIVNGQLNGEVHTSCSVPIYIGLVFGDFEITAGESRNNGAFCDAPIGISGMIVSDDTPDDVTDEALPSKDALEIENHFATVFPNPFFERATIAFNALGAGTARLEIVHFSGKMIAVHDFGWMSKGEHQTYEFVGRSQFPAGLYHYRIITGGHVMKGRMMLLK